MNQQISRHKRIARRLLVGFFVLMLAGTFLSRAADSFTVAQVLTTRPSGKVLTYYYYGSGKLVSSQEQGIYPPGGFLVEEILVQQGSTIQEGTALFRYEENSLKEVLQEKKRAIQEQQLVCLQLEMEEKMEEMEDGEQETEEEQEEENAWEQYTKEAEEALAMAKEAESEAKEDYLWLKEEVEIAAKKNREEQLAILQESEESALEARNEACQLKEEALQEVRESAAKAIQEARQEETDGIEEAKKKTVKAENSYQKLKQSWEEVEQLIVDYAILQNDAKSKFAQKQENQKQLDLILYGGSENYQAHRDETANAALSGNTVLLSQVTRKDTVLNAALQAWARAVKDYTDAGGQVEHFLPERETDKSKEPETEISENQEQAEEQLAEPKEKLEEKWEAVREALYGAEGLKEKREALSEAEEALKEARQEEEKLQKRLADAVEKTEREWAKTIEKTEREWTKAVEKAEYEWTKAVEKRESVENGTLDMEGELRSAKRNLEKARQSVTKAEEKLEEAQKKAAQKQEEQEQKQIRKEQKSRKEQEKKRLEKAQKKEQLELKKTLAREQLTQLEQEQQELLKLLEQDGMYLSKIAGTILTCELSEGEVYSGSRSAFRVGSGKLLYEAEVTKEAAQQIEIGDELALRFSGQEKSVTAIVSSISRKSSDIGENGWKITALMSEDEQGENNHYFVGQQADYELLKGSEYFTCCVPLSALREDSNSNYIYILREREQILGIEQYVVKIEVNVLDQDSASAAIEGMVSDQDEVITSSSRVLAAGDRVRKK